MWFVIHTWGDEHDRAGTGPPYRFLVFTVTGSALMLVGFLVARTRTGTFDIVETAVVATPPAARADRRLLVALGLAVKTRCGRCTSGCPTPTPRPPRSGRWCSRRCCSSSAPTASSGSGCRSPRRVAAGAVVAALAVVGIVYAALACRADRPQAADRLLQRGPHGLRGARRGDVHRRRRAGGGLRQRRARADHRPAVLRRRRDQGPLRHHRPRPARVLYGRVPRWPGCSRSPRWPPWACPGWPGSGARCSRSGPPWTRPPRCPRRRTPAGVRRRARHHPHLGLLPRGDPRHAPGRPGAAGAGRRRDRRARRAGRDRRRLGGADPGPARAGVGGVVAAARSHLVLGVAPGLLLTPVGDAVAAFFGGL